MKRRRMQFEFWLYAELARNALSFDSRNHTEGRGAEGVNSEVIRPCTWLHVGIGVSRHRSPLTASLFLQTNRQTRTCAHTMRTVPGTSHYQSFRCRAERVTRQSTAAAWTHVCACPTRCIQIPVYHGRIQARHVPQLASSWYVQGSNRCGPGCRHQGGHSRKPW